MENRLSRPRLGRPSALTWIRSPDASAGSQEEIARIVEQIRARWPRVRILLRADSGFAGENLMAWCEQNRIDFVFGLARNVRLVDEIYVPLAQAEASLHGGSRTSVIRRSIAGRVGAE